MDAFSDMPEELTLAVAARCEVVGWCRLAQVNRRLAALFTSPRAWNTVRLCLIFFLLIVNHSSLFFYLQICVKMGL